LRLCTQTARLEQDVDLEQMAKDSEGYSGADLRALVNEAGLQALIRIADSEEKSTVRSLTMEDFRSALSNLG
jgi:transitional endoplasmic reticulum ATPase